MFDASRSAEPCTQPRCPQIVSKPPRLERPHEIEIEDFASWEVLATVDGDGKVVSAALNRVSYPEEYGAKETEFIDELVRVVKATRFRRIDDQRASLLTLVVWFQVIHEHDGVVRIELNEYCTEWNTTFAAIGRGEVFGEWKEWKERK